MHKKLYIETAEDGYVCKIFIHPINNLDEILRMIKQSTLPAQIPSVAAQCPYCKSTFQIVPIKKPFKLKCPSCGKASMLR